MVVYNCERCGKSFQHKNDYSRHLSRKNLCVTVNLPLIENDIGQLFGCPKCKELFSRRDALIRHITQSCGVKLRNNLQLVNPVDNEINIVSIDSPELPIIPKLMDSTVIQESDTHVCKFCHKEYINNSNLMRHLKRCAYKDAFDTSREQTYKGLIDQMNEQKHEINNLKRQNDLLMDKIDKNGGFNIQVNNMTENMANNIHHGDINYNIKLVAFGKEDLYNIDDKVCKEILYKGFMSVPTLIEYVHFNKDMPQYHNVYIPNKKEPYAMTYNGDEWELAKKQDIIDQLYDDKSNFLEDRFEEFYDGLNDVTKKKFSRYLNENTNQKINSLKDDIKLLLYNKKNLPSSTKKDMERQLLQGFGMTPQQAINGPIRPLSIVG